MLDLSIPATWPTCSMHYYVSNILHLHLGQIVFLGVFFFPIQISSNYIVSLCLSRSLKQTWHRGYGSITQRSPLAFFTCRHLMAQSGIPNRRVSRRTGLAVTCCWLSRDFPPKDIENDSEKKSKLSFSHSMGVLQKWRYPRTTQKKLGVLLCLRKELVLVPATVKNKSASGQRSTGLKHVAGRKKHLWRSSW